MESNRWAIYTRDKHLALWMSSDKDSLQRLLDDISIVCGDNYYLKSYTR